MKRYSPDPDNRHVGMEEDSLGAYVRFGDHLNLLLSLRSLLVKWEEEASLTFKSGEMLNCVEDLEKVLEEV